MKNIYKFIILLCVFTALQSFALKPTKDENVLNTISPIIHVGAGVQSIAGPLVLGTGSTITQGLQALNLAFPRPSIFSEVQLSGLNSFFSVLQNTLFAQKVFVGFSNSDFTGASVKDSISGSFNLQRLNIKGSLAAQNLDSKNTGNDKRQVCADKNGTLVLCGTTPAQSFYRWHWGACENGTITRDSICIKAGPNPDTNTTYPDSNCVRDDGPKPTKKDLCGEDDNTPLSWNGNPYRQCENGKVIAYVGVVGNEGKQVQFKRPDSSWMNANRGNNEFTYEIPKYDNPSQETPDLYCKTFYYRVPGLPNKSQNDINNGVWGCVNTMTRSECPDA